MTASKYLVSRLSKVLQHTGADVSVVAEYLSTFDTSQLSDMKIYLQELAGGREVEIGDIVEEYCKRRMRIETKCQNVSSAQDTPLSGAPCGCMATRHDLIGSCSSCHRLHCSKEVKLKCVACEGDVIRAISAEEAKDTNCNDAYIAACNQKDKLLQFDKENAARTKVHDAQGDYYVSSAWLSDAERAAIDAKEAARKQQLQLTTNGRSGRIAFDGLDRKIVSVQDTTTTDSLAEPDPEITPSLMNAELLSSNRSHTAFAYLQLRERLLEGK